MNRTILTQNKYKQKYKYKYKYKHEYKYLVMISPNKLDHLDTAALTRGGGWHMMLKQVKTDDTM